MPGWLFKRGVYVGPFIVKLCSFLHSMSESGFFCIAIHHEHSLLDSTRYFLFIKMTHQSLEFFVNWLNIFRNFSKSEAKKVHSLCCINYLFLQRVVLYFTMVFQKNYFFFGLNFFHNLVYFLNHLIIVNLDYFSILF